MVIIVIKITDYPVHSSVLQSPNSGLTSQINIEPSIGPDLQGWPKWNAFRRGGQNAI